MRRRLQSPLFPLFIVHVDRWILNTLQILCFSETIHHLYICRWNCCARCFLSAWRRLCTNSASYEYKNKSASNGAQLVPIGMPIVCWNRILHFVVISHEIYVTRQRHIFWLRDLVIRLFFFFWKLLCRTHNLTQVHGHNWRSWVWAFNLCLLHIFFTPGRVFIKFWSNVRPSETICRFHDSTCWIKVRVTIEGHKFEPLISPLPLERFLFNFSQMLTSMRLFSKLMFQSCDSRSRSQLKAAGDIVVLQTAFLFCLGKFLRKIGPIASDIWPMHTS